MKVLVIGGVAAGTKTAAKLKRVDRSIPVTIITKDKDISYCGRTGLATYVGGSELIVNNGADRQQRARRTRRTARRARGARRDATTTTTTTTDDGRTDGRTDGTGRNGNVT